MEMAPKIFINIIQNVTLMAKIRLEKKHLGMRD